MKHKSGDLSILSVFHFLGDWEDETVATKGVFHVSFSFLLLSFDPLNNLERIFFMQMKQANKVD
ncbi:hypothetical protein ACFYKX_02035 [Cytobacillus sp. FJAT-54145]|uniref:Uncharacterized protein n=1 Tax=Cytobacillus spartinae TaxID=3299023 RepID=A0ABW6K5D3_9BACI